MSTTFNNVLVTRETPARCCSKKWNFEASPAPAAFNKKKFFAFGTFQNSDVRSRRKRQLQRRDKPCSECTHRVCLPDFVCESFACIGPHLDARASPGAPPVSRCVERQKSKHVVMGPSLVA